MQIVEQDVDSCSSESVAAAQTTGSSFKLNLSNIGMRG